MDNMYSNNIGCHWVDVTGLLGTYVPTYPRQSRHYKKYSGASIFKREQKRALLVTMIFLHPRFGETSISETLRFQRNFNFRETSILKKLQF